MRIERLKHTIDRADSFASALVHCGATDNTTADSQGGVVKTRPFCAPKMLKMCVCHKRRFSRGIFHR